MSCLSILAPRQRAALRASSADGAPLSSFASPEPTDGKIRRLRSMATDADPIIRESAALNVHAPADLLASLAGDSEMGVRDVVAWARGWSRSQPHLD